MPLVKNLIASLSCPEADIIPSSIAAFDAKNHTCANNQLIVDFRQSPVLALNSILNFVQQQKA